MILSLHRWSQWREPPVGFCVQVDDIGDVCHELTELYYRAQFLGAAVGSESCLGDVA